jgi:hypothetical protein
VRLIVDGLLGGGGEWMAFFTTGNQGTVKNLTAARPLYNSSVLSYNETILLGCSSNGLTAPPVQTNSNTTPDPTPDKTGNNREIEFKELTLPILPAPPPPDSPVQTNSNTTPDPTPDKTGNNREIEFKELTLEYADILIPQGLRALQKLCFLIRPSSQFAQIRLY